MQAPTNVAPEKDLGQVFQANTHAFQQMNDFQHCATYYPADTMVCASSPRRFTVRSSGSTVRPNMLESTFHGNDTDNAGIVGHGQMERGNSKRTIRVIDHLMEHSRV